MSEKVTKNQAKDAQKENITELSEEQLAGASGAAINFVFNYTDVGVGFNAADDRRKEESAAASKASAIGSSGQDG